METAAATATPDTGFGLTHNRQIESRRAMGLWIEPAYKGFTFEEKAKMTSVLIAMLPDEKHILTLEDSRLAVATVEALGHAGTVSAHVAVKSWADNLTSNGTLKFEAEKAGERIARTAQEQ